MTDHLKRAALPILVAAIILIALVARLSSCGPQPGSGGALGSPSPAAPASPTASPGPVSPRPLFNVSDDDIRREFQSAGFEVRSIVNAGTAATDGGSTALVEFYYPKCSGNVPSRFAWLDRKTGDYDVISDGLLADAYDVSGSTLSVLTTGLDFNTNVQWFPELFRSVCTADAESPFQARFTNTTAPYYMPVDKSFTVGEDRQAVIESLSLDFDAVAVGFAPAGDEEGLSTIPKTGVVCSGGNCYITFYSTVLSDVLQPPKSGEGNALRQVVSLDSDGTNTLLTLKLGDRAERYNVTMQYSPDDGLPYAVITFRSNDSIVYPAGW